MTKKWEFKGKPLGISAGRVVATLWGGKDETYEMLDLGELCEREKLEEKRIKITIETLDEEIEEDESTTPPLRRGLE